MPFNFLALTLLALDQGDLRFARYNLTRLLPSAVYLAGLLVLWALDAVSVAALVWASWLGTALTALVRLYQSRAALRARPSLAEARRLVAFGARLHGAALLAVLLAGADRFVIITFWDDASLGLYVVALTLATAGLSVVTGAFTVLLLPRLAAAADAAAQRRIMGATLRYATLLLSAGTAVLLLLCPVLLPFLFGDAYAGAIGICLLLLLAYLPTALLPGDHPTGCPAPATGARASWPKVWRWRRSPLSSGRLPGGWVSWRFRPPCWSPTPPRSRTCSSSCGAGWPSRLASAGA